MKQIYIINGLLESGKTEFISYTLSQPYFQVKGKTLLVVCEEGENEYEATLLKQSNTIMEVVEEEEDFTPKFLMDLYKKHRPERIIIEWNGMWNAKDLKLPIMWEVAQQITLIDGSTFSTYFANMKSIMSEMIKKSELVIMNRCDGLSRDMLGNFFRNIRVVNKEAEIVFEDKDGEINLIMEENLPYNLNDPIIKLDDEGYFVWIIDMMDSADRYIGKTIEFLAQVMIPPEIPNGFFIPGRQIMNCCAEDIQFMGFCCKCDDVNKLQNKQWVKVTAEIKIEAFEGYEGGEGPVLYAKTVVPAKAPKEPVIGAV